jgi:hypothetical protein
MVKGKKQTTGRSTERTDRVKLTPKESLKRLQAFALRKEQFIASVRKGKGRGVSA